MNNQKQSKKEFIDSMLTAAVVLMVKGGSLLDIVTEVVEKTLEWNEEEICDT